MKICATIQALRWRVTKQPKKRLLKMVIYSYMHYDLLDCDIKSQRKPQRVLDHLLASNERPVVEYTITFLNALVNERIGRSYLL